MLCAYTIFVDTQRLGIFGRKPGRRSIRGSPEDDSDVMARSKSDGAIEP